MTPDQYEIDMETHIADLEAAYVQLNKKVKSTKEPNRRDVALMHKLFRELAKIKGAYAKEAAEIRLINAKADKLENIGAIDSEEAIDKIKNSIYE